jgi:sec-independent protein translocase protein TatB
MNVLGMGPMEILLIVVLALIVFGPAKLPEIMGQVGKAINDFRRATSELSDEFNRTIQAELKETRSVIDETRSAVTEAHTSVTSAVSGLPAPARTATPTEAAPAPNGTGPEAANNGAVPGTSTPPLADTSQWSWETAAPAASKPAEGPAASTPTDAQAGDGSSSTDSAATGAAAETPSTSTQAGGATAESSAAGATPVAGPGTIVEDSAPGAPPAAAHEQPRPRSAPARRSARDELRPPY